jgi:NAD(P)-dependent dehydrogenase (short-subunit alcohol dehydrogenase family)
MFAPDEVSTLQAEQWDAQLAVNLKAPVFLAKGFAQHLPEGVPGNIINIIDQRILRPTPRFFSYTAAKMGLWAVTRTLAQALAPRIRVNAIGPGPVLQSAHQTETEFRAEYEATLLERSTRPQEIAAAVRFILEAPALTGQMIALDGGQHLAWQTPDVIPSGR